MSEARLTVLPVTVITGFLGSGKTTLLNRLIHHPRVGRVAVVVNEFGEVGLDNLLIEKSTEDMVLLDSGCVCCAIRNDLVDTLVELSTGREQGRIPEFTRVVIETSGLADPAPILHSLMTHPDLTYRYYLDGIVTTVDALEGERQLEEYPESAKQAAMADRLVLTKTDLAEGRPIHGLREQLQELNPAAGILEAVSGDLGPGEVLNVGLYDTERRRPDVRRWLRDDAYGDGPDCRFPDHAHTTGIESYCIYRTQPVSRAALGMWLNELTRDFGDRLLRIKGIVNVSGMDRPMVVHGVQHRLYPPARMDVWPFEDHRSRIVFIARGLGKQIVEELLESLSERFRPALES